MSETVIKVENLTKFYQLGLINHGTLAKDLQGWWARIRGKEDPNSRISLGSNKNNNADTNFIYALKDVSFDVKQGEVLGIIGAISMIGLIVFYFKSGMYAKDIVKPKKARKAAETSDDSTASKEENA